MVNLIALFDACVLYPAPLRDLLMHLSLADLFQAKWTDEIHNEWIRNVLKNRPDLTKQQLERTRNLMNLHTRDCLVEGYQKLIPKLRLPDENDRHILAAAIQAKASVIVTYNLSDFPNNLLKEYGIATQHPDLFIIHLIHLAPSIVCAAIKRLRLSLKNPSKTVDEYLSILEKQRLNQTVEELKDYKDYLS